MTVADVLFGRPLATDQERTQKVGPLAGIPVLGLDALASAAYGPEAALTLLLPLGVAGPRLIGPISAVIIALMSVLYISYRQTIAAYPNGGGSYTVASQNLRPSLGVLAGAALAVDYILNVAVGISAGVGAIVSAVPRLQPHTLALCLAVLVFLTLVNLRGVYATGVVFMLPTYLFVGCMTAALIAGVAKTALAGGHPTPVVAPPRLPAATEMVTLWLVLRAFASGCTAMTGVEAVSNGVTIFRKPTTKLAQRTLGFIVGILALLLVGIAILCRVYHIGATVPGTEGYQSILSQLLAAVAGRGAFYYVAIAAIFSVLALSANTSFADFPRLCRVLALDRYLVHSFANRGRRLVLSHGVVVLAIVSGILLAAFGGVTDRLIPLFAIGAFLAFTLSQAGMVEHWRRWGGPHARRSMIINAVGALATGITVAVVLISKFAEGAWVTVLLIAALVLLFRRMHAHYVEVVRETEERRALDASDLKNPIVIVPIGRWSKVVHKGLRFAVQLSRDVRAVQVVGVESDCEDLTGEWRDLVERPLRSAGIDPPRLEVLSSSYRHLFAPLMDYIHRVLVENPDREVAVVVPELVERRWYHMFLHTHRATQLKTLLLLKGDPRLVIINTPWYLCD